MINIADMVEASEAFTERMQALALKQESAHYKQMKDAWTMQTQREGYRQMGVQPFDQQSPLDAAYTAVLNSRRQAIAAQEPLNIGEILAADQTLLRQYKDEDKVSIAGIASRLVGAITQQRDAAMEAELLCRLSNGADFRERVRDNSAPTPLCR